MPQLVAFLGFLVLVAASASAIVIEASAPVATTIGDEITIVVGLDEVVAVSGYELYVSFDPSELAFVPSIDGNGFVVGNLFPDSDPQSQAFPRFVNPAPSQLPIDPTRARFVHLRLLGHLTRDLFELTFEVPMPSAPESCTFTSIARRIG